MVLDNDWIYVSMLNKIFVEYCDAVMTFVEEDKYKRVQELGRIKTHTQKKRCKDGLKMLPVEQREKFVIGCYDELRIQLLRQLYRVLGETEDYKKSETSITERINEEIKEFKKWLKGN
jgi:hypothetical protein